MSDSVVIVGAGPVGLMLAHELALAGVRAVVIERSPEIDDRTVSGLIHARSVELLEQRGLMEPLRREHGEPLVWDRLHFASFWLDMSELAETDHSVVLLQNHIQRVLSDHAAARGVRILRRHELIGLSQDEEGVTARVRSPLGEEEIRCRYLVGCDGEDSAVRELAGFAVTRSGPSWYGLLADVGSYAGPVGAGSFHAGGMFGQFGDASTMFRLMTIEIGVEAPPADRPVTLDEVRASIERITGERPTVEEPLWLHRHGNVTILADHYRNGRVFLAGDAAHFQFHPAGHAVTIGLQDAVNLGWKLAADVQGRAPAGLLDTYEAERRPYGRRACVYGRAQMALLDTADGPSALREVFGELLDHEVVNRHLVRAATDARHPAGGGDGLLGRRVPLVRLGTAGGEVPVAETLHAARGVLLDLSGGAEPPDVTGWKDRVDVVAAEPAPEIPASAVLVRPDGHIAWAGETAAAAGGLRPALAAWFGEPAE
ncbi:FAD-dependent monooxygenase [Actinomadura sp. 7K534]|uniref:FAD-dependent monooxygenase n=1 Tax=Actinomadura sp. 7K534 TaxID=2530366 RepID=UPI0010452757|nr:FAD-dependent monooxygenase [Actinomadura sp. 7K534]TDB90154.1 hypothetical protein E1266_28645 [Actinomadura sp. 7K534]